MMNSKYCRLCRSSSGTLIRPCQCEGSMAYAHSVCLAEWVHRRGSLSCEVCQSSYNLYKLVTNTETPNSRSKEGLKLLVRRAKREVKKALCKHFVRLVLGLVLLLAYPLLVTLLYVWLRPLDFFSLMIRHTDVDVPLRLFIAIAFGWMFAGFGGMATLYWNQWIEWCFIHESDLGFPLPPPPAPAPAPAPALPAVNNENDLVNQMLDENDNADSGGSDSDASSAAGPARAAVSGESANSRADNVQGHLYPISTRRDKRLVLSLLARQVEREAQNANPSASWRWRNTEIDMFARLLGANALAISITVASFLVFPGMLLQLSDTVLHLLTNSFVASSVAQWTRQSPTCFAASLAFKEFFAPWRFGLFVHAACVYFLYCARGWISQLRKSRSFTLFYICYRGCVFLAVLLFVVVCAGTLATVSASLPFYSEVGLPAGDLSSTQGWRILIESDLLPIKCGTLLEKSESSLLHSPVAVWAALGAVRDELREAGDADICYQLFDRTTCFGVVSGAPPGHSGTGFDNLIAATGTIADGEYEESNRIPYWSYIAVAAIRPLTNSRSFLALEVAVLMPCLLFFFHVYYSGVIDWTRGARFYKNGRFFALANMTLDNFLRISLEAVGITLAVAFLFTPPVFSWAQLISPQSFPLNIDYYACVHSLSVFIPLWSVVTCSCFTFWLHKALRLVITKLFSSPEGGSQDDAFRAGEHNERYTFERVLSVTASSLAYCCATVYFSSLSLLYCLPSLTSMVAALCFSVLQALEPLLQVNRPANWAQNRVFRARATLFKQVLLFRYGLAEHFLSDQFFRHVAAVDNDCPELAEAFRALRVGHLKGLTSVYFNGEPCFQLSADALREHQTHLLNHIPPGFLLAAMGCLAAVAMQAVDVSMLNSVYMDRMVFSSPFPVVLTHASSLLCGVFTLTAFVRLEDHFYRTRASARLSRNLLHYVLTGRTTLFIHYVLTPVVLRCVLVKLLLGVLPYAKEWLLIKGYNDFTAVVMALSILSIAKRLCGRIQNRGWPAGVGRRTVGEIAASGAAGTPAMPPHRRTSAGTPSSLLDPAVASDISRRSTDQPNAQSEEGLVESAKEEGGAAVAQSNIEPAAGPENNDSGIRDHNNAVAADAAHDIDARRRLVRALVVLRGDEITAFEYPARSPNLFNRLRVFFERVTEGVDEYLSSLIMEENTEDVVFRDVAVKQSMQQ